MSEKKIVIFGGSFNPPGLHHEEITKTLMAHFDEVFIVPCGNRPDKRSVNDIAPIHRAAMVDLAFYNARADKQARPRVMLFDLENETFTRTHELDQEFASKGEVWHFVGGDWIEGGVEGKSRIQREWQHGPEIWQSLNFVVGTRPGYKLNPADLPPHNMVIPMFDSNSSQEIRDRIFHGEAFEGMVNPRVAAYIKRYNFYRGGLPNNSAKFQIDNPKIHSIWDDYKDDVLRPFVADKFGFALTDGDDYDINLVAGGDGTILKAIGNWRERRPYLGINKGKKGNTLNDVRVNFNPRNLLKGELDIIHSPLLRVEITTKDGRHLEDYAFNEARVQEINGFQVWVQIAIDGKVWIKRLYGDGVLLATPAGSTAYNSAMGGPTLPFSANAWLMVGNNVFDIEPGKGVKSPSLPKILPIESVIELRNDDDSANGFRPLRAFVDRRVYTDIESIKVRVSRIAAVELLFLPGQHLEEKRMGRRRIR